MHGYQCAICQHLVDPTHIIIAVKIIPPSLFLREHRVDQKFDNGGNFILKWGALGSGDGEFDYPFGVATDGDGNVYVADVRNSRIQKFDANGVFLTKWGTFGTGDGQFTLTLSAP